MNDEIAQHYDNKRQFSVRERQNSPIIRLKDFNNWIKSVLINEYVRSGDRILDLCCGKGGDLNKWRIANISHATFADISPVSVDQCKDRYLSQRAKFGAQFFAVDCFSEHFLPTIWKEGKMLFDVVSCQFAYHYSFASKESLLSSLKSISSVLPVGGTFIATLPDAETIYRRLLRSQSMEFGNSIYRIRFSGHDKGAFVKYGQKYEFWLKDAIDNCPEFMVHGETLKANAKAFGLKCTYWKNFSEVLEDYREKYASLLQRMMHFDVHEGKELMNAEEWEASTLYLALVFVKE